jgi:hypothetical protein
MQKKALILGAMKNGDPSEKTKILLEKIHNIAGDGEDGEGDPDEEFDEERGKGGSYSNALYHILILVLQKLTLNSTMMIWAEITTRRPTLTTEKMAAKERVAATTRSIDKDIEMDFFQIYFAD